MQGNRDVVSDCAVGSVLIVVPTPILRLFAGICKAHEPVCVQAFRPGLAVEAFDESVLLRLAGGDVVPVEAGRLHPPQYLHAGEFSTVIGGDCFGCSLKGDTGTNDLRRLPDGPRSPLRVNAAFGLVKTDTARLPHSNECGQILETLKGNIAELRKFQILTLNPRVETEMPQ